jgi:dTDP-4-dehydrorhamnose 3,5-epimerase-like enzyme
VANLIQLPVFRDERGALTVLGDCLPFEVKRVYFIHSIPAGAERGGHRHRRNRQALICVSGKCEVIVRGNGEEGRYLLNSRDQCLLLEPSDWHVLREFSADAVLLVAASEPYNPSDYVCEPAQ